MKLLLLVLFSSGFISFSAFAGSTTATTTGKSEEGFALIHVADLQKSIAADKAAVHIYDANNDKTRKTEGLIPGRRGFNKPIRLRCKNSSSRR